MGVKQIIKYKDLPFEVGKTYTTKFATGDRFLLTKINITATGRIYNFEGIYEKCPHLGECSLGADRLIPERIEDGTIDVCDECGTPIKK